MRHNIISLVNQDQLIKSAIKGSKSSFEQLIEKHQKDILKMIFYRIRSKSDAEDIAQDVFIKAFHKIASLKKPDQFRSWLYKIALNKVIDFANKSKRRFTLHLSLKQKSIETNKQVVDQEQDHLIENKTFWQKIDQILSQLPGMEKEVFILKYLDHLTIIEISEALGKSESTIKTHLYRALKKVRNNEEMISLFKEKLG